MNRNRNAFKGSSFIETSRGYSDAFKLFSMQTNRLNVSRFLMIKRLLKLQSMHSSLDIESNKFARTSPSCTTHRGIYIVYCDIRSQRERFLRHGLTSREISLLVERKRNDERKRDFEEEKRIRNEISRDKEETWNTRNLLLRTADYYRISYALMAG